MGIHNMRDRQVLTFSFWLTLGLALIGILVAAYLTWSHLTNDTVLCAEGGGCDQVRQSTYAEIRGIPVALIGLLGYLIILVALLAERYYPPLAEHSLTLAFGLSLVGTLYSAYLTYLELFVIHAICPYCVASAIIMLSIFILAVYRLSAVQQVPTRRGGDARQDRPWKQKRGSPQ